MSWLDLTIERSVTAFMARPITAAIANQSKCPVSPVPEQADVAIVEHGVLAERCVVASARRRCFRRYCRANDEGENNERACDS
ncbi:MAG TPA: hypothetical protein VFV63_00245 [Ilumatobacteraceae bacterium]|nr:hypothetical protein [Ilumatobacteraceae bacterium]